MPSNKIRRDLVNGKKIKQLKHLWDIVRQSGRFSTDLRLLFCKVYLLNGLSAFTEINASKNKVRFVSI